MSRVVSARKLTDQRFVNLYELGAEKRDGEIFPYLMASRKDRVEDILPVKQLVRSDAITIVGCYQGKLVLVEQFRYPLNGYVYEFPAGLIEENEVSYYAAVREMKEETGLDLVGDSVMSSSLFTSVGMTDESTYLAFSKCEGELSTEGQESTEDIYLHLADVEECKRILAEEKVSAICACVLMAFILCEGDFDKMLESLTPVLVRVA